MTRHKNSNLLMTLFLKDPVTNHTLYNFIYMHVSELLMALLFALLGFAYVLLLITQFLMQLV